MGRGVGVKQFGASDLLVRLMTLHAGTQCAHNWLHLPGAAVGKAMLVPCPNCPRMPTAPALCPGSLLLKSVGCPDVRDLGLAELPVQTTLTAHSHHPSKGQ